MDMEVDSSKTSPNLVSSLVACKCARCRTGKMFRNKLSYSSKKNMSMHDYCPACGQRLELEVGFYYGTGYMSYAITVAISVATFIAYWVLIGISINDNSLFIWLGVNIGILVLMVPYIMRLSRASWLAIFLKYEKNWKDKPAEAPDRIVEEQMKNW